MVRTLLSLFAFFAFCFAANAAEPKSLPDGGIAQFSGGDVRSAQYGCPTARYAHGILGDAVEAGCLVVTTAKGEKVILNLPQNRVFEDITPRLEDLDNDGTAEIVTIESDSRKGAALIVYQLNNGLLQQWAQTPFIGTPNRWLAPIGIADFDGDGTKDIALVRTPHIGGILQLYRVGNKKLEKFVELDGFSNHRIGVRQVTTSKIADFNEDGVLDIALPDAGWRTIRTMSFKGSAQQIKQQPYDPGFFKR